MVACHISATWLLVFILFPLSSGQSSEQLIYKMECPLSNHHPWSQTMCFDAVVCACCTVRSYNFDPWRPLNPKSLDFGSPCPENGVFAPEYFCNSSDQNWHSSIKFKTRGQSKSKFERNLAAWSSTRKIDENRVSENPRRGQPPSWNKESAITSKLIINSLSLNFASKCQPSSGRNGQKCHI